MPWFGKSHFLSITFLQKTSLFTSAWIWVFQNGLNFFCFVSLRLAFALSPRLVSNSPTPASPGVLTTPDWLFLRQGLTLSRQDWPWTTVQLGLAPNSLHNPGWPYSHDPPALAPKCRAFFLKDINWKKWNDWPRVLDCDFCGAPGRLPTAKSRNLVIT